MAGVRGLDRGVAKRRLSGVVVVVIAVALGDAPGVVGEEAIAFGDHDVAVVAGIAQAQEGIHFVLADYLAGLGVISSQTLRVGNDNAGGQLGYLGLALLGFETFVRVPGVVMAVLMVVLVSVVLLAMRWSWECRESFSSSVGAEQEAKATAVAESTAQRESV